MRSLRDITKDEEITFNYVEVGDPTETRRRYRADIRPPSCARFDKRRTSMCRELMDNFFFHCTCPRCQANLPEVTPAPKGISHLAWLCITV